jgi:pyruvate/2-oxoglutarate dehydrogenase complex dihydrolipoamide acyltransferase (E2) component
MATVVMMPRLTDTMLEGKILEWLKKEGEPVEEGAPLFVVETDKAAVEVNATASGILLKVVASEGESVGVEEARRPPGQDIAHLLREPERMKPGEKRVEEARPSSSQRIKASPAARRLARERGIDLARVAGSGEGGLITEKDVESFGKGEGKKPAGISPYGEEERRPLDGVRRAMARRMAQSSQETARVTTVAETDVTDLQALSKEKGITITSFIVRAVVEALKEFPIINSSLEEETLVGKKYYNVGVSVASPRGLVVPVLHNAERMNLEEISEKLGNLARKARENRLSPEEISGGTFTVTNSGVFGSLFFTPMINPPESAILGLGKILKQPVVRDDQIAVRSMMYLSLSYDHRIIDGEAAVRCLQKVKKGLEAPQGLLG